MNGLTFSGLGVNRVEMFRAIHRQVCFYFTRIEKFKYRYCRISVMSLQAGSLSIVMSAGYCVYVAVQVVRLVL